MSKMPLMIFALLTIPAAASAQITHVSVDPEPQTRRCSNNATALHENGDLVFADYHGQWSDHADGRRSQNGGVDGAPCGTERVARVDVAQNVVWEIKPNSAALGPEDQVTALLALPAGQTVMTTTGPRTGPSAEPKVGEASMRHATVVLLDAAGEVVWKVRNDQAVLFTNARPFVGDGGELFVEYGLTNYGYEGGRFQLPGGRVWKPGKNRQISLITRLDACDGRLLWEKSGSTLVSATDGELLAVKEQFKRGATPRARYQITRLNYDGTQVSKSGTPWLSHESIKSAERFDDRLVVTTAQEHVNGQNRVDHRIGKLRIFDFTGKQVSSRTVSDGSKVARTTKGAPLRVLSPTNCLRGIVQNYSCQTIALDVLTLKTAKSEGVHSTIRIPAGRFDYDEIAAWSTSNGLWVHALSYYRSGANYRTPAVTRLYSPDKLRTTHAAPERFVWRPVQPKSVASSHANSFDPAF